MRQGLGGLWQRMVGLWQGLAGLQQRLGLGSQLQRLLRGS